MYSGEEESRPTLGQVAALMERANAKRQHISGDQLERFTRHPAGVAPELCRESVRLQSDRCGSVGGIALGPDDQPYFATKVGGQHAVVSLGGGVWLMSDPKKGRSETLEIVGVKTDGTPVARKICHSPGARFRYFVGNRQIRVNEGSFARGAAIVAQDGSVLWSVVRGDTPSGAPAYGLMRTDDEGTNRLEPIARQLSHIVESNDGRVFVCWQDGEGVHLLDNSSGGSLVLDEGSLVVGLAHVPDAPFGIVVIDQSGSRILILDETVSRIKSRLLIGRNRYLSNFISFPEGGWGYVSETTRDPLQCWVVLGWEQPGFELVSPTFQRDGKWCYYGIIGRHLYTMELPLDELLS